jgi:hypothetical protein
MNACFHALNGRNRNSSELGQLTLVDAEKGSGSPQLSGSNHDSTIAYLTKALKFEVYDLSIDVSNQYCEVMQINHTNNECHLCDC